MSEAELAAAEAHAYETIGRVICLHNATEQSLSVLVLTAAGLPNAANAMPVVNMCDFQRKCALLKAYSRHLPSSLREKVKVTASEAEKLGRHRNVAAHSVVGFINGGEAALFHFGGDKMIGGKQITPMTDIEAVLARYAGLNAEIGNLIAAIAKPA